MAPGEQGGLLGATALTPRSPPLSPTRPLPPASCGSVCGASPRRDGDGGTAEAAAAAGGGAHLLRPSRVSDQLDPITEVSVIFVDVGEEAPPGWHVLNRTASGREANLNKGTGGRHIQLCYTRARGEPPLTDLSVVSADASGSFDHPHEGFTVVERTIGGRRANLNEGSGGAQLYIAYRREPKRPAHSAAAAAVAALDGIAEQQQDEEARAPIVDLAVLYTNRDVDRNLLSSANVIGEGYLMVRNMVRDQKGRTVTRAPADMNEGSHRLLQKLRNLDTPWGHSRQCEVRLYYKKRSRGPRQSRAVVGAAGAAQDEAVGPLSESGSLDGLAKVGNVSADEIECVRQLGDGAVGSIWLVRYKGAGATAGSSKQLYALKLLRKARMIRKGKVERVMNELEILRTADHPFVVTLHASFQTSHFLCHMMEYCPGGNLYELLQAQPQKCITEEHARFYAAQVISGLEYLHFKGYIYRDMKPENILLAASGHVRLSDFDLSQVAVSAKPVQIRIPFNAEAASNKAGKKKWGGVGAGWKSNSNAGGGAGAAGSGGGGEGVSGLMLTPEDSEDFDERDPKGGARFNSFVGTVEYVAPEVIDGTGHSFSVDFWIFGVLLYEMLFGVTPFRGDGNAATFARIKATRFSFPSPAPREGNGVGGVGGEGRRGAVSRECKDLISSVLVAEPEKRLGYTRGASEIKAHPWFRGLRWALLRDEAPPLVVVPAQRLEQLAAEEEEVAAAAAAMDGSDSGLESLSSVLAREQADGVIADASSPAVKKWTVGRESSASSGPEEEEELEEDDVGFGGAMAGGGGSSGSGASSTGGKKKTKSKKPGTPEVEATSSLFADFAFDGLATTRDAYGRDITPVKPAAVKLAAVPEVAAAANQGGLPAATPPPVKARVRTAAAFPTERDAGGDRDAVDANASSEAAEYALRAEC